MKKHFSILTTIIAVIAMLIPYSCSNEELEPSTPDRKKWNTAGLNLNVKRLSFDSNGVTTRAIEDGWQDGDKIYFILKDKNGNNVEAYTVYNANTGEWEDIEYNGYKSDLTCSIPRKMEAYFFDGKLSEGTGNLLIYNSTGIYGCMDGIYVYPEDGDLTIQILLKPLTSRIRFSGEAGTKIEVDGIKRFYWFDPTTGSIDSTTTSFSLTVDTTGYTPYIYGKLKDESIPELYVTNNETTYHTKFDINSSVLKVGKSGYMNIPTKEKHRGWVEVIYAESISILNTKEVIQKGDTLNLGVSFSPSNTSIKDVVWTSSNSNIISVSPYGVLKAVGTGTVIITATYAHDSSISKNFIIAVPAAVDLGLTSRTLWASFNLGAQAAEDMGDEFAWGETTAKSNGTWSNYKWCNGTETSLTKYNTNPEYGRVDNLTELLLEDDAARKIWGGQWRMPSYNQVKELLDECTVSKLHRNGVYGYLISSKVNSNSIFIPMGTSSYNYPKYWTRFSYSWYSNIDDARYAITLYFGSSSSVSYCSRQGAVYIRPVIE